MMSVIRDSAWMRKEGKSVSEGHRLGAVYSSKPGLAFASAPDNEGS